MPNFTASQKQLSFKETQGRCGYCGKHLKDNFEMDHVIPKSRNGTGSRKRNILAVCLKCNRLKSDKGLSWLKKELKTQIFYFESIFLIKGEISIPAYSIYGIAVNKSEVVDPYEWENHFEGCKCPKCKKPKRRSHEI